MSYRSFLSRKSLSDVARINLLCRFSTGSRSYCSQAHMPLVLEYNNVSRSVVDCALQGCLDIEVRISILLITRADVLSVYGPSTKYLQGYPPCWNEIRRRM